MSDLDTVFDDQWPGDHRSGVVAVVGRPNVGKSTLINAILKQKIAIVTPKPQTTRRRQLGIYTEEHGQILFVDTPGLHSPQHKLGEFMVTIAEGALKDADVILVLLDISAKLEAADQRLAEQLNRMRGETPVVLALNKADLLKPQNVEAAVAVYSAPIPHDKAFVISALKGTGVAEMVAFLLQRLPEGPRYYPTDQVSEVNLRFVAAEIVRERAMLVTQDEIPYSLAVEIESYQERSETLTYISAILYVEQESQKGILVGKGGGMIKRIGTEARKELAVIVGTEIYLDLRVKVLKNWRSDEKLMRRLGYGLPKDDGK